ncbi:ferredoxin reductase-like protein [Phyllosticta capitalensis]|uniref:Ferredoxin reductase-like protein n=1 Tax=Phyllosticta capitalensis TaxID=121624 RepID=A0ABR1YHI0_9PEZI
MRVLHVLIHAPLLPMAARSSLLNMASRPLLSSRFTRLAATSAAAGAGIFTMSRYASRTVHAESTTTEPPKTFASGFKFRSLRLHSSEDISADLKRLRFELPDPLATSGMKLTSSLATIIRPPGALLPIFREYTPVNDPETTGFVDLVVKKYPNGALSTHLHDMTPGQSVLFAGPLTRYQWKADNAHPHVAMVAGGTGICPMWQLLHGIFANPADRTKVTLVWGVNNERELFLRDELAALQRRFPDRLRVVYAVSNPLPGSPHAAGRVTREVLEKAGLGRPERSTKLFLCGPPAMEKAVGGSWNFGAKDGILRELGYEKGQVERL